MLDLLREPLLRLIRHSGGDSPVSLPDVYAALAADDIANFVALRPHQRHPWHAVLCQLGALACLQAGLAEPPPDAATWRAILAALTPDFPDGEPWHLVSPDDKPAFLQSVTGALLALEPKTTPDELDDVLVTSRNHDLKRRRIAIAEPDSWLFALTSLQTAGGRLGAVNFGVSRINSGFGNRPCVGLAPDGGVGKHVFRDISRLILILPEILDAHKEYSRDGVALIWLKAWDGSKSMSRAGLHPYYVEVCRRVRLVEISGRLAARVGNSKAMRIFMHEKEAGVTGDPWTPVVADERGRRALTVDAGGFHYRRLSDILFARNVDPAPLQLLGPDEDGDGWSLVCRALTRGQGKTEGFHERRVPIPRRVLGRMKKGALPALGDLSTARIGEAGAVRSALRFALMTLFQNGPDRADFEPRDPSSARRAEPFLDRFGRDLDRSFFADLFAEAELDSAEGRERERRRWLDGLRWVALAILRSAEATSPTSAVRRHRALVRAEAAFGRGYYGARELRHHFEGAADAA